MIALILSLMRSYWKPLAIVGLLVVWSLICDNHGRNAIQARWDKANAEALAKVAENKINNIIFNQATKGRIYDWKANLDIELNNAINSLPNSNTNLHDGRNTTRGINAPSKDCGIYPARAEISKERIKTARIAKEQALILKELQDWQLNHPRIVCKEK
jgi:hypothetical protein